MAAAKPALPEPVVLEVYAAGWVDITSDLYQRQGITVTHGLPNETSTPNPFQATLMLGNRPQAQYGGRGRYDPDNPNSDLYGALGRNTPIRCAITAEADTFGRTVSNGWGTNDSGDVWGLQFWIGSNSNASFAVGSGVGTHTVTGTNVYVATALTNTYTDVDVAVTVTVLAGVTVTGGQIEPANILLRGVDSTHYYMVRCTIQPSGAVTLQLMDRNAVALSSAVTASVTHSATSLRVRAQVEGQTLRAKVWDASGAEPAGWLVTANYLDVGSAQQLDAAGWVGIRSGVATGNTNTNPLVFSYDNLTIRIPRFAGWIAALEPTETEISGTDRIANVTVGGIMRQLNQSSQAPLQSALRHDIPSLPNLVAYWPCEDDPNSTQLASALQDGKPMSIASSGSTLASDSSFPGSAPLPVNNGVNWLGYVTSTANVGAFQVRMLIKFPAAGTIPNNTRLFRVHCVGSYVRYDVMYSTGGALTVIAADSNGETTVMGATGFNVDGQSLRISLWVQQSGSNITGQLSALGIGATAAGYSNFSTGLTGVTLNYAYAVSINPPGQNIGSSVVGHVTVENAVTDIFALLAQLNGFTGERATARMARLCAYSGIEFDYTGDRTARDQKLGPQSIDTLWNVLQLAARSDGGLLYEAKGAPALAYRTSGAHLSQTPVITLDRAQHQLGDVVPKTVDDQTLRNDVTATRINGSSFEATQDVGPLSVQLPPNGVGPYPYQLSTNLQLDSQLQDAASWAMHLGTVADPRIPSVTINLSASEVTDAMYWQALAIAPDVAVNVDGQNPDRLLLLARGYSETFGGMRPHVMVLNTAPGAPYRVLVLDDGASRLDSDTSTLHASINASVTSFQVDVADGVLWTTNSADRPFDIVVDGERMTVTNVTGSSSPQTFTVTRAVNGIARGHGVGAHVFLFTPYYLGLGSL